MKAPLFLVMATLAFSSLAQAGFYYNGTGGIITDGGSPLAQTIHSTDVGTLGTVSLLLNINGGYNGDYYAYLSYNDGSTEKSLILVNHMGGGSLAASGSGFGTGAATLDYANLLVNGIKLVDGAAVNIHDVTPGSGNSVPVGNYAADSAATFSSTFQNMNASGTWTLVFADTATPDQGSLVSWGLDIEPVPEPVNVALGIVGGLFGLGLVVRQIRNRRVSTV